jgi:hypothetical protein
MDLNWNLIVFRPEIMYSLFVRAAVVSSVRFPTATSLATAARMFIHYFYEDHHPA